MYLPEVCTNQEYERMYVCTDQECVLTEVCTYKPEVCADQECVIINNHPQAMAGVYHRCSTTQRETWLMPLMHMAPVSTHQLLKLQTKAEPRGCQEKTEDL